MQEPPLGSPSGRAVERSETERVWGSGFLFCNRPGFYNYYVRRCTHLRIDIADSAGYNEGDDEGIMPKAWGRTSRSTTFSGRNWNVVGWNLNRNNGYI